MRDAILRRQQTLSGKLDKPDSAKAVIVAVDGSVWFDQARRLVWVQRVGDTAVPMPAYNRNVKAQAGIPVLLEIMEGSQFPVIRDLDVEVMANPVGVAAGWLQSAFLTDHANDHEPGGNDQMWLYPEAFTPLAVVPGSAAGLTITVINGYYERNGVRTFYPGAVDQSISASQPSSGQHRFVGVYIDSANALGTVDGTAVATGADPDEPTWPAGSTPLAVVDLDGDQTDIQLGRDISNRRAFLTQGASGAPIDAQYITILNDDTLTDERRLAGGTGIAIQDYGEGDRVEVAIDIDSLTTDSSPDGSADYVMTYDDSAGMVRRVLIDTLLALGGGGSGYPFSVLTVDPTAADADYTNISDAISAASAGDVIGIGPGTYNEALTINKAITLKGVGNRADVVITASAATTAAITANAKLENLTINNTDNTASYYAVQVSGSGVTGTIVNCAINASGGANYAVRLASSGVGNFTDCAISGAGGGLIVVNLSAANGSVTGGTLASSGGTALSIGASVSGFALRGPTVTAGTISGPWTGTYQDGTGGQITTIGTSFPGSPATGQQFYRSDLGWHCYYDGTRWLTTFELAIQVPAVTFSATTTYVLGVFRTDYAPYVTRVRTGIFLGATNNGSNYWTVVWRGINAAYSGATTIKSETTSADGTSQWVQKEGTPSTAAPLNKAVLDFSVTKIGAPTNISVIGTLFYRLIVT